MSLPKNKNADRDESILDAWFAGKDIGEIAYANHCTYNAVQSVVHKRRAKGDKRAIVRHLKTSQSELPLNDYVPLAPQLGIEKYTIFVPYISQAGLLKVPVSVARMRA